MAARTRATVLLQGESGTGKELFARAVCDQSDRADRPFVKLNCAALPEGLIESALFGHERGAFTGAIKRVEGAFERAHGGTLLLDEVSEMRLDLQAKLLRVLQEQEFERVGGTSPIKVDVRIIATTNRDLAAEAAAGTFRRDLYYRLGVIPILIPPLRERLEDIPLLATRFAMKCGSEMGKDVRGISPEALRFLQTQEWPGNIRELQHAVERAVILSDEPILQAHAFDSARYGLTPVHGVQSTVRASPSSPAPVVDSGSAGVTSATGPAVTNSPDAGVTLTTLNVADVERTLIARALEMSGGNRTRASELLGISVRTLRNKLNSPSDGGDEDQPN
jgi:transcriptional regulator with GAF, ATPase, and Fis domain